VCVSVSVVGVRATDVRIRWSLWSNDRCY